MKNLTKRLIAGFIVGIEVLVISSNSLNNYKLDRERYSLAKSKIQELVESDHLPGTSPAEWKSIYKLSGLQYDEKNPGRLTQKNLDDCLGRFGYEWNGKEYTDDILAQ